LRTTYVGLADDFKKGCTGTVEINEGILILMNEFSCILFQMNSIDAYLLARGNLKRAALTEGKFVLGNLVILGKVGIKVILSLKINLFVDATVERIRYLKGKL